MLQAEQILHDRYQLQQKLGRTAAGRQTWLTVDLQSNEQVIVKLLAFSPQMQWDELKLFEREAQVLANLNHPRIPRYRDYFSLDGQIGEGLPWFGLVQDYIPGATLQELLEQGKRFTQKQVRKIATQVLNILIYLHQLSPPVLHRDIKPSNLILGEDEQVYLVDFGAVQDKGTFTGVTFTVVGTSGYAPLEQFWGRAVPASDLYALGATLIHLLTGIAPVDLPQKDSRIQFANRVSLNPNFVSWIENLTETAIEKRFSTALEALEALESGLILRSPTAGNSATRKIPKPPDSRIKMNKSAERLEICIVGRRIRNVVGLGCGRALAVLVGTGIPILLLGATRLIGLITLVILAGGLLTAWGKGSQIEFDRNHFQLKHQIFGFTYLRQKAAVSAILGIFLHHKGGNYQLGIRSENYLGAYSHFLSGALSDIECAWLAQEIQDWLNAGDTPTHQR